MMNRILTDIAKAERNGRKLSRITLTRDELHQLRTEIGPVYYYHPIPEKPGAHIGTLFGIPLYLYDPLIAAAQRAADQEESK